MSRHCAFEGCSTPAASSIHSIRLCQFQCAMDSGCAYFTFTQTSVCHFHCPSATKVTSSSTSYCGPTPRCPYRHKLQRGHLCTTSSISHKSFPWPFFNEFSLEPLLLRRWTSSLLACRNSVDAACAKEEVDVVIIPSLYLHTTRFRSVNPWDVSEAGDSESYTSDSERGKRHSEYWTTIRHQYNRCGEASGQISCWPVMLVHNSYVFDASWSTEAIHALSKQPLEFQQRVIIGEIANS